MPSRENNIEFAFYAIAEVESGWNWGAVNMDDPITLGIMQNYAYNAKRVLLACREQDPNWSGYASAAPRIADALDSVEDTGWTSIYLDQTEANAWVALSQSDENHTIQSDDARAQMSAYLDYLVSKGMTDDEPKTLIFAASMYHQSPARCLKVLGVCSPGATLDYIYQTCLNDSILGRYKNRYTAVYNRLNEWDGESAPPDFGQNGDDYYSGQPDKTQTSADVSLSRIFFKQGRMIIFGSGYENGIQCRETTPGNWIPQSKNVTSGSETNPQYTNSGSGDFKDVLDLYDSWERDYDFVYSQGGGRLSLPDSGGSDCSGSIWCAFHQAAGIDVGVNTYEMASKNQEIIRGYFGEFTQEVIDNYMQPGDLVLMSDKEDMTVQSRHAHVELYMGDGYQQNLLGGGSAPVPHYKDCIDYMNTDYTRRNRPYWMIRRAVKDV